MLQALLDAGANLLARDYFGCTPLHTAVDSGCSACLALLLAAPRMHAQHMWHAHVNVRDASLGTPLHHAVSAGNVAAVEKLAAAGANVNFVDKDGATPLILAASCRLGRADTVRALLAAGAQLQTADTEGWTALHHAADRGRTEIVELLVAQGASVNAALDTRDTPLHLAVKSKHTFTVQVLLAAGADVYTPGSNSRSALCMAAAVGHMTTIECLVEHRWLDEAAAINDMVRSAAAAAQATSLDPSTKQSVVKQLLLTAVKSNTAAAKAALTQCTQPAGNTALSVLIDAWLESEAVVADIEKQRTAVQHLIVSMAAAHKQQQAELKHAWLAEQTEIRGLQQLLAQERAALNQQRKSLLGECAYVEQQQYQRAKQLANLQAQQQAQAAQQARQQQKLNTQQQLLFQAHAEVEEQLQHMTAKAEAAAERQALRERQLQQKVEQLEKQLEAQAMQNKEIIAAETQATEDKDHQLQVSQLQEKLADEQSNARVAAEAQAGYNAVAGVCPLLCSMAAAFWLGG
jgi:ankyrin repeat protein